VLLFDQGADAVENLPVVHGLLRGLGRCSLPAMMPLEPRYCICWCPDRAG
jgi:hypothetical protein